MTRLDSYGDTLTTKLRFWFQRSGVVKALEKNYQLSGYTRPQFGQTQGVLVKAGETVTVTAPYGGPIYLKLEGANGGAATAVLRFVGVAKHPAADMASNSSISEFISRVATTTLPCVDLYAEGVEVHSMMNNWRNGIRDYLAGNIPNPTLQSFLDDYRFNFVEKQFTLAGLKAPGKGLNETLPLSVKQLCQKLGWPCLDLSIHGHNNTQHSNYDDRANCGDGCSGNPWDAGKK